MRFLADENVPIASVQVLRDANHDVVAVADVARGATDADVLQQAHDDSRILITFDRDFGALVFGGAVPVPPGVIFLRFEPTTPDEAARILLGLLDRTELRFEGRFTVVDRERVRQRDIGGGV